MEIVVFVCLMIVPVLSIGALFLSLLNARRLDNMRKLVSKLVVKSDAKDDSAMKDLIMSEI